MKLKKSISIALSGVMILSLSACKFNPFGLFGNSNGNSNIVEEASKMNKDAVFKEKECFSLDGWNYYDSVISSNGKTYVSSVIYDYPEFDDEGMELYYEDEMLLDEPVAFNNEIEGAEALDLPMEPADSEEIEEYDEFEEYDEDYYYEDVDYTVTGKIKVASFTNSSDVTEYEFEMEENESYGGRFLVAPNGDMIFSMCTYDMMSGIESAYLKQYDSAGNLKNKILIDDGSGDYYWINYLEMDNEGNVYICDDTSIQVYSANDLKKIGEKSIGENDEWCSEMFPAKDGGMYVQYYKWDGEKDSTWMELLQKDGSYAEVELPEVLSKNTVISGEGYDFYYRTNTSVFGMNFDDKEAVEIVNFYDSDISSDELSGLYFTAPDQFISTRYNEDGMGNYEIVLFEKVPADQVVEKEVITIGAVYLDYYIQRQVMKFNKENDKYKIKLVDYSEFNSEDDWSAGEKRLNSDLANGQAPDIISSDSYKILNLMKKGVFEDLTPYMENGSGIKKSDLIYNAQNIYADGDKLYCVYPLFSVECCIIDKNNYKEGMTLDDVIEWENATGNKAFPSLTLRDTIMFDGMNMGMDAFMNAETGKCTFDSPEFIKLLNYAKTYEEEFPEEFYDYYTYDSYLEQYSNGKVLIDTISIYDLRSFNSDSFLKMNGNGVPCDYPIENSSGSIVYVEGIMGINSKCKNKEAAWEFISSCFDDEFYESAQWSLPTVERILDERIEEAKSKPYYINEKGEKEYYDESVWLNNQEVIIPSITDDKATVIKEYITHAMGVYCYDEGIRKIIDEETQPFFKGQKSAEEVASIIQSRVQIYVNEKQ